MTYILGFFGFLIALGLLAPLDYPNEMDDPNP